MKYTLYNKNIPVVDLDIDEHSLYVKNIGEIYNQEYKPFGIKEINKNEIYSWLSNRKIPASRDNIEELLDSIDITTTNLLIFKAFALSLSDQYWLKPENQNIKWEDINFFDNDFSDDLGKFIFGNANEISSLKTPDNTSDGDLKKSWKIIDGKRVLIKAGRPPYNQEPFNEILASEICKRLKFDYVEYKAYKLNNKIYCGSENFIDKNTELVSAWDIYKNSQKPNHINKYQWYISLCKDLGVDVKKSIDDMIVLDYIVANEDRHFRNFGLIRNINDLKFIKPAPIFDTGYSMYCQQGDSMIGKVDKSKPFRDKHENQIKLVNLQNYDLSSLNDIGDYAYDLYSSNAHMEEISTKRANILAHTISNRVKGLEKMQELEILKQKNKGRSR